MHNWTLVPMRTWIEQSLEFGVCGTVSDSLVFTLCDLIAMSECSQSFQQHCRTISQRFWPNRQLYFEGRLWPRLLACHLKLAVQY